MTKEKKAPNGGGLSSGGSLDIFLRQRKQCRVSLDIGSLDRGELVEILLQEIDTFLFIEEIGPNL